MLLSNVPSRCMAEARQAPVEAADLCVTLAASLAPGVVQEGVLRLPAGACVADALSDPVAVALLGGAAGALACGIWGRVVAAEHALRDGDRLELYRPLTVDPKVARRERFARQGARTTGLFARQRPGGKAGY